ncbi:Suppressor of cytokine signaling 2 [Saguinus oedipus]|uniref:Suppressor of cytokine signaling 2 n=1 Tax=Saguinus oedipus TaxID=9490 RepID=A0ABQ9VV19_SAGOE|nr:Suppressor of cytokine signaling 2 [Saguinus oedipus]
MTLRCLEPSGNGGEGTQSQWGTRGRRRSHPRRRRVWRRPCESSVRQGAGPTNLRIEYQDGKFRLDSIVCVKSKLKQFDSVVHLIDYYVQICKDKRTGPEAPRNGTVHLYLTKPLYTSAPSLQHLCRLTTNKCTGAIWGLPLPTRLKDYLEEYKFQV